MATPVDKKKKEQERIKKQLMVLGFMLVLVVFANRNKFMGGGTRASTPTAKSAGSSNTPEGSAAAPPVSGAPAPAGGAAPAAGGAAQTPYDIPTLTPEVVTKLRARASGHLTGDDDVDPRIFINTVDPFTSFTTDVELQAAVDRPVGAPVPASTQARSSGPARTAEVPRALLAYHAFGVMVLDGEKQAIIKRDGRVVPYHLKEGEHFEPPDDNFKISITGDNRVWIENTDSPSAAERYFELSGSTPRSVNPSSAPPAPLSTNSKAGGAEASQIFLDESF